MQAVADSKVGYFERRLSQRSRAALRAISLRSSEGSFFARAFPPFRPPRRPSATAAGFFVAARLFFAAPGTSAFRRFFRTDRVWHGERLATNCFVSARRERSMRLDVERARASDPRGERHSTRDDLLRCFVNPNQHSARRVPASEC